MLNKLRFYLSIGFIDKIYLLRDVKYIEKKYNISGELIDIGCGIKPYKKIFKKCNYKGIDFSNFSINKDFFGEKPDFYFDEQYLKDLKLPFKDEVFQNSAAFQVLEHHRNPQLFIKELCRITKKGGYVLLTFPFMYGLHERPNDFFRFTEYGMKEILSTCDVEIVEILRQGSLFSTIASLFNQYLDVFACKNKITYILSIFIYLPFLIIQYCALVLDMIFKSKTIFSNYLFLIKKLS